MTDPGTEEPEDKALQDHTFGKKLAEKTEEAERRAEAGEPMPPDDGPEVEHHAGGKA